MHHDEMSPLMKKAKMSALKELISKMRHMEAKSGPEDEGESPMEEKFEQEGVDEAIEPLMDGYNEKKPGVLAEKGQEVDDGEDGDDLEAAKKEFFKRPASGPIKGRTRAVIMSMTMKPKVDAKMSPTKRHLG